MTTPVDHGPRMEKLPENLSSLHLREESLRVEALELVRQHADLAEHVVVIEVAMDVLHFFIQQGPEAAEDDMAQKKLGIRVLNDISAAWKLVSSGYFQIGAMVLRDVVETTNLIQHFRNEPAKINEWHSGDAKVRRNQFKPVLIREALDAAMGGQASNRSATYTKFSQLAAHPTVESLKMLGSKDTGANVGPFMDVVFMRALLFEQARLCVEVCTTFIWLFQWNTPEAKLTVRHSFVSMMNWLERHLGHIFSAEVRANAEELVSSS